jgi:excisionase family DNA binding protein
MPTEPTGLHLQIDPQALRPLIEEVVNLVLARLESERAHLNGKLCYSEPEAAELLGLKEHQLRDERRRGRIRAASIVGRRIRYTREDLMSYLLGRQWEK